MHLPTGYLERTPTRSDPRSIEAVWTFLGHDTGEHRVLPDGRCDIILRFTVNGDRPIANINAMIAGPSTAYHDVAITRGLGFVGVRLRPGFARHVLGLELSSVAGQVLSGATAINAVPALADLCAPAKSVDVIVVRLKNFVDRQRLGYVHTSSTPRSLALLDALHTGGGRLSVSDLAQMHGIDERTARRDVVLASGLGPKELSMIVQFHRAVRLLRDAGLDPASAAAEAGYSDQAHMTRMFRKLGGFAPGHLPNVTLADLPI